jgi:predicted transcriptional regulator
MSPDGRGNKMGAVTITVTSNQSFRDRVKSGFAGKRQDEKILFESFDLLWKVLAPNRMALVKSLTGIGPVSLREAARRVGRDVRAVHSDVHMLLDAGVLRKDELGRIEFPYTAVHVDFMLKTAASLSEPPRV